MIPFALYAFVRPDLRAFDSYAFYEGVCGNFELQNVPFLAEFALKLLPCSFFGIKVALFLLFFLSTLGIACLGTLFHPTKGWMAAVFSFLSPSLIFEATKFENDQFAIPILIWSMFFFYKARKTGEKKYDLVTLALILFAAGFWSGAIYWLLAFSITSLVLIPASIAAIAFPLLGGMRNFKIFLGKLIGSLLPFQSKAIETQPFIGLGMVGFLVVGFALVPRVMIPQMVVFTALLLLQIKFAWFVMPILSVGALMFYTNEKLDKNRIARQAKGVMLVASLFLVVVWGITLQGHPPLSYHWEAIEFAIEESEDGFVYNDWSVGYWIIHKGGTPSQYGGGKQLPYGKGIVVTGEDLDCELLKEAEEIKVWRC